MRQEKARILIVDDDEKILFAFHEVFKKEGYKSAVARDGAEALKKISADRPDVVFMDITMPKLDGLEALKQIQQQHKQIPVIIITGFGTMQTAISAIQLGAFEYLTKPLEVTKIREVTQRALASTRSAESPSPNAERASFDADMVHRYKLVGNGAAMQEIYKIIGSISTTPNHTSVMILGESGTGKELVARAIHANSPNNHDPFIAVNCTVLPETLLESELFGHEKGAFTGAIDRRFGKFEIARGGTIFLDEVGNLSPTLQQKLLRVLQEREFERVGGNDPIQVDARFIAATNRDIESEVRNGNFREDLFYRMNVVTIHLPPLHERKEDIPLLAGYFLSKYDDQLKKSVKGYSDVAMELLQTYDYPGNVRELENLVERAVMLTKGEVILPETLREMSSAAPLKANPLPIISPVFSKSRDHVLKAFERQFLIQQLTKYHGNVTSAATASRMTRQNFQRLMKKNKIQAQSFRR
ncbi:MAG TPA: sigma-54 dependent transcriptional regulator [Bacteroidota bacterium]